jgi:hypothetical protein
VGVSPKLEQSCLFLSSSARPRIPSYLRWTRLITRLAGSRRLHGGMVAWWREGLVMLPRHPWGLAESWIHVLRSGRLGGFWRCPMAEIEQRRVGQDDEKRQGDQGEALTDQYHLRIRVPPGRRAGIRTMVFQLMGSTKELITPAKVSAMTLVRPTMVGSRFMQVSQARQGASLQISLATS